MEGDPRIFRWARRLLVTGGSQVGVQGIGFISGILVIRYLSTGEYAFYTIANSVLGVMTTLTDGGIGSAVMALGGRVWEDDEKLGPILAAGLHLRRRFAVFSLTVSIPILAILLRRQGAAWETVLLLTLAILVGFFGALTNQLLEIIPKLRQHVESLQKLQLGGALLRLALIVVVLLALPRAWGVSLAAGLALAWMNIRMRRWVSESVNYHGPGDPEARRRIMSQVSRTLPGAIYYASLGQITVGLIALFGSNGAVAHVGVAARLAMAFTVVTQIVSILLVPRFARMKAESGHLLPAYFGILAGILGTGACLLFLLHLFPGVSDLIVGHNYTNTHREVSLALIGCVLAATSIMAYTLGAVRGRILAPYIAVPAELIWQIIVISHSNVTTAQGVLTMGAWGWVGPLILYTCFNARGWMGSTPPKPKPAAAG